MMSDSLFRSTLPLDGLEPQHRRSKAKMYGNPKYKGGLDPVEYNRDSNTP